MPVLPPAFEDFFILFLSNVGFFSADSYEAGGPSDTLQNNNRTYIVEKSFTRQPRSERSQK